MSLMVLQDGSERIRYNNPRLPLYVRRGDLLEMPNMAALCHWHDDVEILLPLEGSLRYSVNGVTFSVPQGSAVFVNSRQMHFGYSADGNDCKYVCITFRPQILFGNEEMVNRFVLPILSASRSTHLLLQQRNYGGLIQQILEIDKLYQDQPEGYEMLALSCLTSVWHSLFLGLRQHIEDSAIGDPNVRIVRHMVEYIRTHYEERITLDMIANAGGVCRTRCCQIFRKYLSMTPIDYLNSFRLEKSMELLKATKLPVTEIAAACGYNSSSYFAEIFIRQKGCTPTQFRRQ